MNKKTIISNKKLKPIFTELSIRDRKLNIPIAFIVQSYFSALLFQNNVRLNFKLS